MTGVARAWRLVIVVLLMFTALAASGAVWQPAIGEELPGTEQPVTPPETPVQELVEPTLPPTEVPPTVAPNPTATAANTPTQVPPSGTVEIYLDPAGLPADAQVCAVGLDEVLYCVAPPLSVDWVVIEGLPVPQFLYLAILAPGYESQPIGEANFEEAGTIQVDLNGIDLASWYLSVPTEVPPTMPATFISPTGDATVVVPFDIGPFAESGVPSGSNVCLDGANGSWCQPLPTAPGAGFDVRFAGIPMGTYWVTAYVRGYQSLTTSAFEVAVESGEVVIDPVMLASLVPAEETPPPTEPGPVDETPVPVDYGVMTVDVFATDLPAGSQVCLESDPYSDCADVPSVMARPGVRAFMQVPTPSVTFANVPPGDYTVVLNVSGYDPYVLGSVTIGPGQSISGPEVPAGIMDFLTPASAGPGSIAVTVRAGANFPDGVLPVGLDVCLADAFGAASCQTISSPGLGSWETSFPDLPLGSYRVYFLYPDYVHEPVPVVLTEEAPVALLELSVQDMTSPTLASLVVEIDPGDRFAAGVPTRGSMVCLQTSGSSDQLACGDPSIQGITAPTDVTIVGILPGVYDLAVYVYAHQPLIVPLDLSGAAPGETVRIASIDLDAMVPYGTGAVTASPLYIEGTGAQAPDPSPWTGTVSVDTWTYLAVIDGAIGASRDVGFGTVVKVDDMTFAFYPQPGLTGTRAFTIPTDKGTATVQVTFFDYWFPGDEGRITVNVHAGAFNDGRVPAGLLVCVDPVEPDGPPTCKPTTTISTLSTPWMQSFLFPDLPFGTYRATISGMPGEGLIASEYRIVLSDGFSSGHGFFLLSDLRPMGTSTITVEVQPRADPMPGTIRLRMIEPRKWEGYASHDLALGPQFAWTELPAGTYEIVVEAWPNQPLVVGPVEIASDGQVVDAGVISLENVQAYPLETRVVIEGLTWNTNLSNGIRENLMFWVPGQDPLGLALNQVITVDGIGTVMTGSDDRGDGFASTFSFTPEAAAPSGEYDFTVETSSGPGVVTIVIADSYWMPGDGASVTAVLYTPWGIDPVASGVQACLVSHDPEAVERCSLIPPQMPSASETSLGRRVAFHDLADGTYDLEFRNIPRLPSGIAASRGNVIEVANGGSYLLDWFVTVDQADLAPATGDITIALDTSGLPDGTEICLVNEETQAEACQPVEAATVAQREGVRAFRQATGASLTFPGLPIGTYQVILRAPDLPAFVVGTVSAIAGIEREAPAVTTDVIDEWVTTGAPTPTPPPTQEPTQEPTLTPTPIPPTPTPEPVGSVSVEVDPASVPDDSQLCLVNTQTGEEFCEAVPDGSGSASRAGVQAFMQVTSSVTITFNVPPGTWHLVLRAPGYVDQVIGEPVAVEADVTTPVERVPADIQEGLEPEVPGQVTITTQACSKVKVKNGKPVCEGQVPAAKGATVTYDIMELDGDVLATVEVTLGQSGSILTGTATSRLLPVGTYQACQRPLPGYQVYGTPCVTVELVEDKVASVTFVNGKKIGGLSVLTGGSYDRWAARGRRAA